MNDVAIFGSYNLYYNYKKPALYKLPSYLFQYLPYRQEVLSIFNLSNLKIKQQTFNLHLVILKKYFLFFLLYSTVFTCNVYNIGIVQSNVSDPVCEWPDPDLILQKNRYLDLSFTFT